MVNYIQFSNNIKIVYKLFYYQFMLCLLDTGNLTRIQ